METRRSSLLLMLALLIVSSLPPSHQSKNSSHPIYEFDSSYFPDGFFWGSATSAYQTEGEALSKGRGPSTWDIFTHKYPARIDDRSNGDVAVDYYNRHEEDIQKMNEKLGMNAFRFSISWPRVIPSGNISKGVNEEGIDFYNRVINQTIKNGMQPFVTIFHWDVPEGLQKMYGGFLSPQIVNDFRDYAKLCFERFGDRVKHWITINEPFVFTTHGYDGGDLAPGRCSSWVNPACQAGNSAIEPYIVGHHVLLAHAAAVEVYRQKGLDGKIGITLDVTWSEPYSNEPADHEAAQRSLEFSYGWFLDPLTYGHYPAIMRKMVPKRLPKLTMAQSKSLKGSYDFLGINYYTASYATANFTPDPNPTHIRYGTDSRVQLTKFRDGKAIGLQASPSWLYVYPEGIRYILNYTKDRYNDPVIYITENGVGDNMALSSQDALKDLWRISYFQSHIWNVLRSICDHGVKVKGYFAWSFIDNFEWANGYTIRMGLFAVDRNTTMERHPKLSVGWFKHFLEKKNSHDGPKCTLH